MFRSELSEKFKTIFSVQKVSFSHPTSKIETIEQDCLFVQIEKANTTIKDGKEKALINGQAFMLSRGDKLPYGFFSKRIRNAESTLTKDLFFYSFEMNENIYQDLIKRSFSFIYFYSGQYDPDLGIINSVETIVEDTLP